MRGTLTGQRYVDDILRPHVGHFLNGLPGAFFQQDNAPPHTARVAPDLLQGLVIRDDPVRERDQAIEIFIETVEFEKGRYIVQLPFRKSYNELSDNYPLAKQRFQNLWRRFGHDSELYQQYRKIIRDYTEQGIIEVKTEITDNELKRPVYYLPHQAVRKDGRLTSKTRIVFDAVYRFNRVKFGVSSRPFLLAATIRHHVEKYKHEFPDTVELLDRSFYVDDLISGGNEFEEALQTSRRAKNIVEAAGMDLRKWIANDANLMEQWKEENFNVHPVHETVSLGANGTKVTGLSWNTNEDYLTTDTKSPLEFVSLDKNTKRFILQAVGKIFDPLGLISPFTIRMKCLLQDLWKEEIQWDDLLPTHIEKEWKKWCGELPHLQNLKIPRLVLDYTLLEEDVELHSFFATPAKRPPLNCVTLRRLELLGAIVTARLTSKVKKIVNQKRPCLQYQKTRWKQFVANRVKEITSLTDPHSWYHCAGKENPADFLSRGLSADCLVSNFRWWTGAEFLSDSEFPKNFQQVVPEKDYLIEHEKETVVQERKKLPEAEFNYNCRNKYGEGIVRVGGRLENASVPYLHKHPAILPKGSKLSKLYFNSLHTRLFHVGLQGLLNAVRQKFWPLSGRSIARKSFHQCVACFKSRPILSSKIMGNLPSERKPKSTVSDVIVKWKHRGSETAEKQTGRPKILDERSCRILKRVVKQNCKSSLVEISQEFQSSSGISVSSRTVRRERELKNLEFYGRAAAHKPNITPQNAKHRLQWCRAHRHWTGDMWKTSL
ncbi:integrase catalytic domain-containing protein [Trichonephila clavipes]|nr:integrase catalytic domain-containing protein [Trichonephila clavipes]